MYFDDERVKAEMEAVMEGLRRARGESEIAAARRVAAVMEGLRRARGESEIAAARRVAAALEELGRAEAVAGWPAVAAALEELGRLVWGLLERVAAVLAELGEAVIGALQGLVEWWRALTGREEREEAGRPGARHVNCRCGGEVLPVRTPDKVAAGRARWWVRR